MANLLKTASRYNIYHIWGGHENETLIYSSNNAAFTNSKYKRESITSFQFNKLALQQ